MPSLKTALDYVAAQATGPVHGVLFLRMEEYHVLLSILKSDIAKHWGITVAGNAPTKIQIAHSGKCQSRLWCWADDAQPVIFLAASDERKTFEHAIRRLYTFLSPHICRAFARTTDFHTAIGRIVGKKIKLRILQYVAKGRDDDRGSRKTIRTTQKWTDEDYVTVFDRLNEEEQWLCSLRCEVSDASFTAIGRMWRNGEFLIEKGLQLFYRSLIRSYSEVIVSQMGLFTARDQRTSPSHCSRPILIDYSKKEIFQNRAENARLVAVLRQLNGISISVLHPNPYLQASIVDFDDGSGYTLWVTDPASLILVPQQKATASSLQRICDHICEHFSEGVISEIDG